MKKRGFVFLAELCLDVGHDGDLRDHLLRYLAHGIEHADALHLIVEQLHAVRQVVAERKNIDDTAAHRKLSGLIHKIGTLKAVLGQQVNDELVVELLAFLYVDDLLFQRRRYHEFFDQRFGIGHDELAAGVAVRNAVDGFGALQDIVGVDLVEAVLLFEGVGNEDDLFPGQQRLEVVHEVGGLFLVVEHEQVIAALIAVNGCGHERR